MIVRLFLTASLLAGCAASTEPSESPSVAAADSDRAPSAAKIGRVVAKIDGHPVGSREFDIVAARKTGPTGTLSADERDEILTRLVEEKLLYREAVRRGIDLDPKIQKMMVNTLLKDEVYSSVRTSQIGDDELHAYFEEHASEFVVPAKINIKRILIKAADGESPEQTMARAEAVRAEVIERPSDFKALAEKHSQGPYARRGGDLGFVQAEGKPGVDPAVVEMAFTLAKFDVSGVFETRDGLNILYAADVREEVKRTFDQMRGSVLRKVKSEKYRELYEGYVAELRSKADIWIDTAYMETHEVKQDIPPALLGGDKPTVGINKPDEPEATEDL